MKIIRIIVCALVAVNAHAGMYKCTDADGKTQYQQTRCNDAAEQRQIDPGTNAMRPSLDDSIKAKQRAAALKNSQSFEWAVLQHQVMAGMSDDQVQRSIGVPDTINHGVYDDGKQHDEQWVYYYGYSTTYIYLTNGVVTRMQW